MLVYVEKSCTKNKTAKKIISQFQSAQILEIDNYKNIFDKNVSWKPQKSIIIAQLNNAIMDSPIWYGFEGKWYFLKNSLNCIYDCSYCYLKWAFKNDYQVYFVNYDDIKKQVVDTLKLHRKNEKVWFYSSDYSDNLATNSLTWFCDVFIPFFETLPNAMMEIRTKSTNIWPLLKLKNIQNTEIAFSLNPQEIVKKYELGTPSLDMRITAINSLLKNNWKVGIRFLPLLEVKNYQKMYTEFLDYAIQKIDFSHIHSVFIGWLMYTHEDYNKILKKQPFLDVLYSLEKNDDGFMREKPQVREWFYKKFQEKLWKQKCNVCLDTKN